MASLNIYFSVYLPVYIYTILAIYFILLLSKGLQSSTPKAMHLFHNLNRTQFLSTLFTLTLLSLLGTPPSIGFFGKILTFSILAGRGGLLLYSGALLALILLIFYLQAVRYRPILKRRVASTPSANPEFIVWLLTIGQTLFLAVFILLPLVFDIGFAILTF